MYILLWRFLLFKHAYTLRRRGIFLPLIKHRGRMCEMQNPPSLPIKQHKALQRHSHTFHSNCTKIKVGKVSARDRKRTRPTLTPPAVALLIYDDDEDDGDEGGRERSDSAIISWAVKPAVTAAEARGRQLPLRRMHIYARRTRYEGSKSGGSERQQ